MITKSIGCLRVILYDDNSMLLTDGLMLKIGFNYGSKEIFDRIESAKDFNYELRIAVLEVDLQNTKKYILKLKK